MAGGMVSEIDGRPSMLYGNSIIATNQRLYDPLRKLLMMQSAPKVELMHDLDISIVA